jgi:hypothetical protein
MKPKPFEILLSPQFDGEHWVYMMRVGDDEHEYTEHMRRAVLMMHAPALLHELKATFELCCKSWITTAMENRCLRNCQCAAWP